MYLCKVFNRGSPMAEQLNIENQVCFPIHALAREMVNHYRPLLEELEITYPQYLVLMVLWNEGELTVGQLGEKLLLDSGTLTPLLKRMEQKGMVMRRRSSADERVVLLSLTEKGRTMKEQARDIPARLIASMKISEEELRELKSIVTRILNKNQ